VPNEDSITTEPVVRTRRSQMRNVLEEVLAASARYAETFGDKA
jgi:hypothetical protein